MNIHYKHDDGYCMTPCPYGVGRDNLGEPKLVGSNACADCPHFFFNNEIEDWVDCRYEEDMWKVAKESLNSKKGDEQ